MEDFELPEKAENRRERIIGLIIAAIAVVLAIVTSIGHGTHNDEILAHVDASDQYAFYQAKKERHEQLQLATDNLTLGELQLSAGSQQRSTELMATYAAEMKKLEADEKAIQAKGDELMDDSRYLARKSSVLDLGEIALQIAVVLCSISILTEQSLFVRMGVTVALLGVVVAVWGGFLPR